MAITRAELQVAWGGADFLDITVPWSAGPYPASDTATFNAATISAHGVVKADKTSASAISGDVVDFWISYSCGDPDGAAADEWDTDRHSQFIGRLDLFVEDPGILSFEVDSAAKSCKIKARTYTAGTYRVSSTIQEVRSA